RNIAPYKKLNFDPAALESVAVLSKIPNLLLVREDFPGKTVAEFIVYAKAHPGGVTFASQGPGTTSHLSGEQFSQLLGARMVHVPYRGTGPALTTSSAGQRTAGSSELSQPTISTPGESPGASPAQTPGGPTTRPTFPTGSPRGDRGSSPNPGTPSE